MLRPVPSSRRRPATILVGSAPLAELLARSYWTTETQRSHWSSLIVHGLPRCSLCLSVVPYLQRAAAGGLLGSHPNFPDSGATDIVANYLFSRKYRVMARDIRTLRNIGIIAHIDAGKTTLTEGMLFYSGAIHRKGEVDKGTTETDFDVEEQERGITIYSACVSFPWKGVNINLIDTPGHVDFTAEVERSLRVLDGGVVVFSAREGVEAQSETVWRQADKYHVPRIAFINKMDREGADFYGTLKEIRERLGSRPVAIQIPYGAGPPHVNNPFRGIIDLIEMRLLTFSRDDAGKKIETAPIPNEIADDAQLWRHSMLEDLYGFSDELMELALAEEEISTELIRRVVRDATVHN